MTALRPVEHLNPQVRSGRPTVVMLVCLAATVLPLSRTQGMQAPAAFVVAGSQFHQRDPDEAGEARVCIQNTGAQPLDMDRLRVRIRQIQGPAASEVSVTECLCVYARLLPPVVPPGQHGEIVAKLMNPPMAGRRLTCDISAEGGAISHTVPLVEPALWIPFTGFGTDLRRIFVYVENLGREPIKAELLRVGDFDMAGRTSTVHSPVPPQDKGCLIGDLPSSLTPGRFVRILIAAHANGRESKVQTMARVIRAMPIVPEFETGDSALGLDVERPFLQTMACPAHDHGTPEEAAAGFLRDYAQQLVENPGRPIQMAVCRNDMPRAWFRFGSLSDGAAMNPCLRPPSSYESDPQKWPCPFFHVGDLARKATEPGRFLAIIPTGPEAEEGAFLLKGLTSQEWRFLVYSAIACGAKGVIYRGSPADEPLSRDAFRQLNRELQHLKPLLLIAEPVDRTATVENGHAARTLLCGDRAILIVVFDSRYFSRQRNGRFYTPPFETAMSSVRVRVRIPQGMTVKEVRTPFASLDRGSWDDHDGVLDFTAQMVDSAQVYVASLQARIHPQEGSPQ